MFWRIPLAIGCDVTVTRLINRRTDDQWRTNLLDWRSSTEVDEVTLKLALHTYNSVNDNYLTTTLQWPLGGDTS
jgi:hypothetical protein